MEQKNFRNIPENSFLCALDEFISIRNVFNQNESFLKRKVRQFEITDRLDIYRHPGQFLKEIHCIRTIGNDKVLVGSNGVINYLECIDLKSGEVLQKPFRGHSSDVECIELFDPSIHQHTILCSCGLDQTLNIWKWKDGEEHTPRGFFVRSFALGGIVRKNCLRIHNTSIVIGNYYGGLEVIELAKGKKEKRVKKLKRECIFGIDLSGDLVYVLTGSGDVHGYDFRSGRRHLRVRSSMNGSFMRFINEYDLLVDENTMYDHSPDIILYDIRKMTEFKEKWKFCHEMPLTGIEPFTEPFRFMTSSRDRMVKIWDTRYNLGSVHEYDFQSSWDELERKRNEKTVSPHSSGISCVFCPQHPINFRNKRILSTRDRMERTILTKREILRKNKKGSSSISTFQVTIKGNNIKKLNLVKFFLMN